MNKVMHSKFYFFRPSSKAPFQFKHYFSLIKDPLWKRVCADAVNLMGPMALQISQVQLGAFSSKDQVADLYCETEEMSHFLQKYNFIILGSLQKYFPNLKELKVKIGV